MTKEDKASKIELAKRVNIVSELILQGGSNKAIYEFARVNWNITSRQADNYIKKCFKMFQKVFKKKEKTLLAEAIAKRELLYRKSYKIQDYKTCLLVLKDIADLQGLYLHDIRLDGDNYIIIGMNMPAGLQDAMEVKAIDETTEPDNAEE